MKLRNVFMPLAAIIGLLVSAAPGVFLFYLYEPPASISYYRGVLNDPVPPGGSLKIHVRATMSKVCKANTERYLVYGDGMGAREYIFPQVIRPSSLDFTYELPIPIDAPRGPAHIRAVVSWECNFIQHFFPIVVIQPPLDFTIGDTKP